MFLDGGFRVNIIIEELRLGLPKPKSAPYNLRMANQTTIKPIGLIKDLKMYVHGIPYIATFIVLNNTIVDSNYSMLLNRSWLGDVKVTNDWGNNMIMIQGNSTV